MGDLRERLDEPKPVEDAKYIWARCPCCLRPPRDYKDCIQTDHLHAMLRKMIEELERG